MQIIPVLDLLGGLVVRAIGGRRAEYRPVQSLLTANPDPPEVLDALLDRFAFGAAYIADLDGIMRSGPDLQTLRALSRRSVDLIIDAGARSAEDVQRLFDLGVSHAVVASESLPDAAVIETLVERFSAARIVFSMDTKDLRPIVRASEWEILSAESIIQQVAAMGVARFILLDLADVGQGAGARTLPLLGRLREQIPSAWFAVGGGVHSIKDVRAASLAGADALLVASALHDGRITPTNLREFVS